MNETTEHTSGVIRVVDRAQKYNTNIGNYIQHFVNEHFIYSVRLTNKGAMTMPLEIAQDQELGDQYVSEDRIKAVAARFRTIP